MTEDKENTKKSETTPQQKNPGEEKEIGGPEADKPGTLFDAGTADKSSVIGGDGTGTTESESPSGATTGESVSHSPSPEAIDETPAAAQPDADKQQQPPKESIKGILPEIKSWIRDLIVAALICLALIVYVAQPFRVEKTSMVPLLHDGDRILVSKISLWYEPIRRGEIVVLMNPRKPDESWIKRVIGLPGEIIQIVDGVVYINGKALPESYISDEERNSGKNHYPVLGSSFNRRILEQLFNRYSPDIDEFLENFGIIFLKDWQTDSGEPLAVKIPEGYYFVCGDNRSNSLDSRDSIFSDTGGPGFIPAKYIFGKAIFRYWPLDKFGPIQVGSYPSFGSSSPQRESY